MTRLEQVGKRVRDGLQVGPDNDRDRLARQQQRLVDTVSPGRASSWRKPAFALAAAVVVLVLSAVIFLRLVSEPPIECHANDGRVIAEGDWVGAPDHTVSLAFTEGSSTEIARQSRVRLSRNDALETRLTLEAGRLRARVNRRGRSWTFQAGPYRVRVTGTQLAVDWNSHQQQFEVAVTEGAVRVTGEGIRAQGITVRSGERLKADGARGEVQHIRPLARSHARAEQKQLDATTTVDPDTAATDEDDVDAAAIASPRPTKRRGRRHKKKSAARSWQQLARAGDFSGALTLVTRIGFLPLLRRASAWDLLLLADASRLGKRLPWARRSLMTLRQRFPRSKQSQLAAFRLGRLAFDHERDYVRAARWLRQFLREAPRHALAAHARGRLMLALQQGGKTEAARNVASTYLRYHPGGSYAAAAKAIVDKGKR